MVPYSGAECDALFFWAIDDAPFFMAVVDALTLGPLTMPYVRAIDDALC